MRSVRCNHEPFRLLPELARLILKLSSSRASEDFLLWTNFLSMPNERVSRVGDLSLARGMLD
jgi:hypothetical protein